MNLEVTSVSRRESTVGESAAAVHIITNEDIRRSGATSIPELLRSVPGVNVARVDANKWAVSARGFNDRFANKLLVQVDGRTVYSPIFSGVFWDTTDYVLADIERIEVIRGPGASAWGANAVNGIINIITRSARDTVGGLAILGAGSEEQAFGTVRFGDRRGETYYRVYAKGFSRDETSGVAPAPHDAWSGLRSGFRVDRRSGPQRTLTVQGDYFLSNADRVDFRPQPMAPYRYTNVEEEISNGGNVLARLNHITSDGSGWSMRMYWDHIKRRSTGDILVFSMDTVDLDFQQQVLLGERHRIVWGLGYRSTHSRLNDSLFDGFILEWDRHHRRLSLPSAFVQDQIALFDDELNVTLGTKLEHNELTGFEVQPTLRILWAPSDEQSVWAAISRAVRTPTLFEDQRSVTQTPVSPTPGVTVFPRITANPSLDAEEVLAYEVGYRTQSAETISLDAAVFYNVYDKLKVFAPVGSSTVGAPTGTRFQLLSHANLMGADTYGAELGIHWNASDHWQLYLSYSFLEMSLQADPNLPAMSRGMSEAAERQSPEQQAHMKSSWNLPRDFEFDILGRYVDGLVGFQQPVGSYVSMDLRLAWRPRQGLALELVGQNLLDERHLEAGGSVLAGPLHELQRGVYGKLSAAW